MATSTAAPRRRGNPQREEEAISKFQMISAKEATVRKIIGTVLVILSIVMVSLQREQTSPGWLAILAGSGFMLFRMGQLSQ
eukprot:m.19302 g.19302  ORF g.19302 m.19302 type:complete len:81 (-) comp5914_c0_seq1:372-614(-)